MSGERDEGVAGRRDSGQQRGWQRVWPGAARSGATQSKEEEEGGGGQEQLGREEEKEMGRPGRKKEERKRKRGKWVGMAEFRPS